LFNNQLGDYLRKSKKQIFLNNICLTSILQESFYFPVIASAESGPLNYLWIITLLDAIASSLVFQQYQLE